MSKNDIIAKIDSFINQIDDQISVEELGNLLEISQLSNIEVEEIKFKIEWLIHKLEDKKQKLLEQIFEQDTQNISYKKYLD